MLTFEQALLLLKSGEDVRLATWPRRMFVRAIATRNGPALVRFNSSSQSPYVLTDLDVFSNQWSKA